jgi:hypothetical protein
MAWTQDKINEIYLQVQKLAATDEEFRAELLQDPRSAIEKISDEALPENYNIKVIENDPVYAATFVLPAMVPDELIDDFLEQVAGGACAANLCGADGNCGAAACGKQA